MLKIFVFVALAAMVSGQAPPLQPWPSSYHMTGSISMPYADIDEPLEVWYDGDGLRERVDVYNGLDSTYYFTKLNLTWFKTPAFEGEDYCFESDAPVNLQSVFPDISQFQALPNTYSVEGVLCYGYQWIEKLYQRTNTYTLYMSVDDATPVEFLMLGANIIFGSHYDQYILRYKTVQAGPIADSVFSMPEKACRAFPGPGAKGSEENAALPAIRAMTDHIGHQKDLNNRYNHFKNAYNKADAQDEEEEQKRQLAFHHNTLYIASVNHQQKGYRLAINHLADMTKEELSTMRGTTVSGNNFAPFVHAQSDQSIPDEFDWRIHGAVNKVKDQGVCGSCWSFGTAQHIEGAYFVKTGKLLLLSQQLLMDCTWEQGNNGCNGGEDFRAYEWIMASGGMMSEEVYGHYLMADGKCHWDYNKAALVAKDFKGYVNVTSFSESDLLDALVTYGPISIAINAAQPDFSFYASGVYDSAACKGGYADLDHAVSLVGYGGSGDDRYWIVKNSWSTHWGDEGYIKIARQNNICGVASSPTYVLFN